MENTNWLLEVCKHGLILPRAEIAHPFTWERDGKPTTVATNGNVLVEIPGFYEYPAVTEKLRPSVEKVLAPTSGPTSTVSFEMLKSFIDVACIGVLRSCEACKDTGADPEDEDLFCPVCKGDVSPVFGARRVYLGGVLFNARLLELPFSKLPFVDSVRWWNAKREGLALIDAGIWRVGIMPMRDTRVISKITPRFEIAGARAA